MEPITISRTVSTVVNGALREDGSDYEELEFTSEVILHLVPDPAPVARQVYKDVDHNDMATKLQRTDAQTNMGVESGRIRRAYLKNNGLSCHLAYYRDPWFDQYVGAPMDAFEKLAGDAKEILSSQEGPPVKLPENLDARLKHFFGEHTSFVLTMENYYKMVRDYRMVIWYDDAFNFYQAHNRGIANLLGVRLSKGFPSEFTATGMQDLVWEILMQEILGVGHDGVKFDDFLYIKKGAPFPTEIHIVVFIPQDEDGYTDAQWFTNF